VSHLQFPIRDQLRDPVDEAALARVWRGIDGRFPRRRRRSPLVLLGSTLALAGAAAVVLLLVSRDAGPLALADGRPLVAVEAPAEGAVLPMSDGSSIELGPGARLESVESSGTQFVAVLEKGRAGFEVRPGGPRRWRIECGLATVEVVGTRFSCERSPNALRVAVQRGVVLVSGERVPNRARRLSAGEALTVEGPPSADAEPPPPSPSSGEPAGGAATDLAVPAPEPSTAAPSARDLHSHPAGEGTWRELARGGRLQEAYASLGPKGIGREARRLGVTDLFALADVARLSGHPLEAEGPLQRIVTDHADDPQAPLAAFALGRLELDSLGKPERAAASFARALELGVPRSLREDLRARLVEAYLRAGNRAAARSAARDYNREFPDGRYARSIDARLSGDSRLPGP
jgi:transmembrane sensor